MLTRANQHETAVHGCIFDSWFGLFHVTAVLSFFYAVSALLTLLYSESRLKLPHEVVSIDLGRNKLSVAAGCGEERVPEGLGKLD